MDVYLIGVDLGTQGTKAALFDEDMRMVATAFEASRLVSPKPGVVWQEADDLYASLVHVIRDLVEQTGINGNQIVSIGIDGQMAGIMGISSDGSATTYYDSWLDMRCGPYADRMNAEMGSRIIALLEVLRHLLTGRRSSGGNMSNQRYTQRLRVSYRLMRIWFVA